MSIDHGRLLALADHAAALSHRLSRMGGDSVFRAVEAREIEQGLRALAQPAEAVEGSGSVAALVAAANAVLAENPNDDTMWSLEAAVAPFNASKPAECANGCPPKQVCDYCQVAATDAAQGAVVYQCGFCGMPSHDPRPLPPMTVETLAIATVRAVIAGVKDNALDGRKAVQMLESAICMAPYTHPQAAPAQGDRWKLVPVHPTAEMLRVAIGTMNYSQSYETAEDCYRAMLAAAPSQEGES